MLAFPNLKKWDDRNIAIAINDAPLVKKGESPFIVPFINTYYFWGLVPFQLTLSSDGSHYTTKKNIFQQILCSLSHCLSLGCTTFLTYSCVVVLADGNPSTLIVVLLEFISNVANTILIFLMFYMFWRREDKVLELVNCTRVSYDCIPPEQIRTIKRRVSLVTLLFILVGATLTFCLLSGQGHYLNTYENGTDINSLNPGIENATNSEQNTNAFEGVEAIFSVIMITAYVYTTPMYPLAQGIFLLITLALRQLGKEFEMNLEKTFVKFVPVKNSEEARIREGVELYKKLRRTTDTIKKLVGFELMIFCIASVSYYCEAPHILMGKRGNVEKVMLVYFMQTLIIWFIAAEFHHHVKDALSNWIGKNLDSWELKVYLRIRLMELSSEANTDPIALQNKYFIVTYSYVCGLLSMTATYGLIVFQLQGGDD